MKDKREIEIGDYITTETIGAGEKLLKVESIREVDGVKKYYAGGEGVQGVHAVSEDDVVDHATPEEYQKYLESLKGEVDSDEEEGNVTTETATTVGTESKDPSTLSEAGNDTTSTQQTTQDTTLTQATPEPVQHVSPDVVSQSTAPAAPAQQQQGNKNQNNKRRV